MNYTRKRALLACDFCRHRKRRCDGKRPCSTCKDSNADCVYKELPFDRVEDASPGAVVDRLARIESLLEHQSHQINSLSTRSSPMSYAPSQVDFLSEFAQQSEFYIPSRSVEIDPSLESPQFLIPIGHYTVANTLLSFPQVREVLGEHPRDFFFQLEEKLPLPDPLNHLSNGPLVWPQLEPAILSVLSESYFRHAHPHHPLFTRKAFEAWQAELLGNQQADDVRTALCFLVYAIGAFYIPQGALQENGEALGLQLFQPALRAVLNQLLWAFRPSIEMCQACALAGSYFAHLGRPLHSWRMTQFASRMFLNLVEGRKRHLAQAHFEDAEIRIFWYCFMIECDRIADLDVCRSGIEPLGDRMPLPQSNGPSDDETTIYFIAEHAIRRLMNRIHNALYATEPAQAGGIPADPIQVWQQFGLPKLLAISSELNRQLEEWYHSIPEYVARPTKGADALPNDRVRILRVRYYAAKEMIHRPFLLLTVARQPAFSSPSKSPMTTSDPYAGPITVVADKCETCIDSSVSYLYNAAEMITERGPYLWSLSHNSTACLIQLWMASTSHSLCQYVPNMQQVQSMMLARLRRWATRDSSFEAEVQILERLVFSDPMAS